MKPGKNSRCMEASGLRGLSFRVLAASLRALHRNISVEIHPSQVPPKRGKTVSVSIRLS